MSKTSKIVTKTLAGVLSLAMVVTSLSITGTTADAKAKIKSVKVKSPVVNGGKLVLKKGQKNQISTKIPNPFIAGMVYWLFLILVVGICVAGTGILAILIEIKVIELYKKNCWDVITLLMILTSAAVIIYFGEVIKKALSINLLFFWLILQGIYLTIRRYISQDTD